MLFLSKTNGSSYVHSTVFLTFTKNFCKIDQINISDNNKKKVFQLIKLSIYSIILYFRNEDKIAL